MSANVRIVVIGLAVMGFAVVWYALLGPAGLSESFSLTAPSLDFAAASSIQPLFDLVRVGLRSLPGHELQAIWWSSMLFVAAAAGLTLLATYRVSGSLRAATVAALILVFGVDGLWTASTIGPASLAFLGTSAALAVSTIKRHPVRHVGIAIIGGVALGLSPVLFVVCALFWLGEARDFSTVTDERGTSGSLSLPPTWLLVPLIVVVAIIASNPWLWDAPLESAKAWILTLLKNSPSHFSYLGHSYTSARPPIWLGVTVLFFETPIVVLVLAGLPLFSQKLPDRMRRNLFAVVAVSLLMPWIIRSTSWHGVPINAIWAPALAILAGSSLEGLLSAVDIDSRRARATAIVATGLVVCGLAFETLAWRAAPAAYRNPLVGPEVALRIGDPLLRAPSVSPAALSAVPASSRGRLTGLNAAYQRAGFVVSPEIVPPGTLATAPNRFGKGVEGSGPFARPVRGFEVRGIPILWREE